MQQKIYQFFSIDPDLAWNTNGTYPVCPETKSIQKNVQREYNRRQTFQATIGKNRRTNEPK